MTRVCPADPGPPTHTGDAKSPRHVATFAARSNLRESRASARCGRPTSRCDCQRRLCRLESREANAPQSFTPRFLHSMPSPARHLQEGLVSRSLRHAVIPMLSTPGSSPRSSQNAGDAWKALAGAPLVCGRVRARAAASKAHSCSHFALTDPPVYIDSLPGNLLARVLFFSLRK